MDHQSPAAHRYECGEPIFLTDESTESIFMTRVLTTRRESRPSAGLKPIRSSSIASWARPANPMSSLMTEAMFVPHILQTFNILFPKLRDGGFYFVEDTQTSYWPDYGGSDSEPDDPRTTVGFFKQMIHGLNHVERQNPREPTYFEKKIISITFFHNLICIKKGDNLERTNSDESQSASAKK